MELRIQLWDKALGLKIPNNTTKEQLNKIFERFSESYYKK
jgi:hypothetical protein